jgi:hypothetical protein
MRLNRLGLRESRFPAGFTRLQARLCLVRLHKVNYTDRRKSPTASAVGAPGKVW